MKRSAIVVNPSKVKDLAALRHEVNAIFWGYGWAEPRWLQTTPDDPGVGQARQAVNETMDMVCALGGDGTVRCVASALLHTGTPLAVLPRGSGNVLARNLDLPRRNVLDGVRVALSGHDRVIDAMAIEVDRDGDGHFEEPQFGVVMSGIGVDASIMRATSDRLKSRLKWMAYPIAAAPYLDHQKIPMAISYDGDLVSQDPQSSVLIGNCGILAGGGHLMPDAVIDDGWLDVAAVSLDSAPAWVPLVARTILRSGTSTDQLARARAKVVEIRTPEATPIEIDGDYAGEAHGLRATVVKNSLVVRVR